MRDYWSERGELKGTERKKKIIKRVKLGKKKNREQIIKFNEGRETGGGEIEQKERTRERERERERERD